MNANMARQRIVYGLHAGDLRFGYIGSTTANAKIRWWEHRSRAQGGHTAPVYEWMRQVGVDRVQIEVLIEVPEDCDLKAIEAEQISRYLRLGHPLMNQLSRDGVVDSMSQASRDRIGAAQKGRVSWIAGKRGEEAGWTEERKEALRKRRAQRQANRLPRHGTTQEYMRYGCRCDACTAAALHPRQKVEKHGRYLYKRDHCRCDICVEANRAYLNAWNSRKRDKLAA